MTAGISSVRAKITPCEVGPPCSDTIAATRSRSRRAKCPGRMLSLKTIEAVQDALPVPHEISAKIQDFDGLYTKLEEAGAVRKSA